VDFGLRQVVALRKSGQPFLLLAVGVGLGRIVVLCHRASTS
jgi:hypothetical protein